MTPYFIRDWAEQQEIRDREWDQLLADREDPPDPELLQAWDELEADE